VRLHRRHRRSLPPSGFRIRRSFFPVTALPHLRRRLRRVAALRRHRWIRPSRLLCRRKPFRLASRPGLPRLRQSHRRSRRRRNRLSPCRRRRLARSPERHHVTSSLRLHPVRPPVPRHRLHSTRPRNHGPPGPRSPWMPLPSVVCWSGPPLQARACWSMEAFAVRRRPRSGTCRSERISLSLRRPGILNGNRT